MAVDLFSEASPRNSFSHDINQPSLAPTRSDPGQLDTGFDFEFGVSDSFAQESSSADELFSQGILLPSQTRQKSAPTSKQPINKQPELPAMPQSQPKTSSFWSFKRSSSLSCEAECKKGLLPRSNSTGSVPNSKKSMQNKDKAAAISSSKHPPLPKFSSTSSSSSSSSYYHQKLQHSKGYYGGGGSYGPGGPRTSSVLNVPPPYISNTNIFGLSSLFRNGKDRKPKK